MKNKEFIKVPIRRIPNEIQSHKFSDFEIHIFKPKPGLEEIKVDAHRHDYYHIMLVESGHGENIIDFKTYDVKPNALFFISPGQVHSIAIDQNAKGYVLSFNSNFFLLNDNIQKLLDFPFFHSISNSPAIYLPKENQKIKHICDDIYTEFNSNEKGNVKMIRALLEILLIQSSRFHTHSTQSDIPVYSTHQLRTLEALIDKHFKEYKHLNDYADLMHISSKHLNSLCKKGINKTVTNLIHERTMLESKRLLLFTNNTISEIAFELGFSDKSYFMRFFKKHTNSTADTYRNQGFEM